MTLVANKNCYLSHFWDAPHRPLFLASFVCAVVTVAWWPLGVNLGIPAPAFEPIALWHVHELIFGFAASAVAGYLLTALPSWTGHPPVRGGPLQALILFWVLSRLATALADKVPVWLLHAFNTGYFLLLIGILCQQLLFRGHFRKCGYLGAMVGLGGAEALFIYTVKSGPAWDNSSLAHTTVIGFALLITVVATRAIPAFTNNWLIQIGRTDLCITGSPTSRYLAIGLMLTAISGIMFRRLDLAYGLLVLAAIAIFWNMRNWRTAKALSNPLLAAQHLAFLWVPIGLLTIGLLWFHPTVYPMPDAIHTLTIGAMSGLIMAIAGRAASHHKNGELRASKGFVQATLMIWITTWVRLAAPLIPYNQSTILLITAVLWCLGWGIFIVGFIPALAGPATRPVLSGTNHKTADHLNFQKEKGN